MLNILTNFFDSWKMLSWNKVNSNIFRLQKRIFKSVLVGDLKKCLQLQRMLLLSNSARLLSIRFFSSGKVEENSFTLNFLERFELNNYLLNNVNNWKPDKLKKIFFPNRIGSSSFKYTFLVSDKCWQNLVQIIIEPSFEALVSPRNFGFRGYNSIYRLQKDLFSNLSKSSFGYQKRVFVFKLNSPLKVLNYNYLLKKIIVPRSIKIGIFRFLKSGFLLDYPYSNMDRNDLSSFLSSFIFFGFENFFDIFQFGFNFLIFLTPNMDEKNVIFRIKEYFSAIDIKYFIKDSKLFSSMDGFNFLDWHFKVYPDYSVICTPKMENYHFFLKRVKNIINNSNYGAVWFFI